MKILLLLLLLFGVGIKRFYTFKSKFEKFFIRWNMWSKILVDSLNIAVIFHLITPFLTLPLNTTHPKQACYVHLPRTAHICDCTLISYCLTCLITSGDGALTLPKVDADSTVGHYLLASPHLSGSFFVWPTLRSTKRISLSMFIRVNFLRFFSLSSHDTGFKIFIILLLLIWIHFILLISISNWVYQQNHDLLVLYTRVVSMHLKKHTCVLKRFINIFIQCHPALFHRNFY